MSDQPPPAAAAASGTDVDWRKSVPQSYRSSEVREVAKVLAALEPGASSTSKLMLAMRFEDGIFQSADSLADYRKRLTKRLKKVQKSYAANAAAGNKNPKTAEADAERAREREAELERELRAKYGPSLRFIVDNAAEACRIMSEKSESRAAHLRQHTDNAEQWAVELGVVPEGYHDRRRRTPREDGYLDRLSTFLEQRVENIRGHVVKQVQPDSFLSETLSKLEGDLSEDGTSARRLVEAARRVFARTGQIQPARDASELRSLLDRATAPVPPPRRGGGNEDDDVREAGLAHVGRIRAGSGVPVAFVSLHPEQRAKLAKDVLRRCHESAVEGLSYLEEFYVEKKPDVGKIRLEDAWTKVMTHPSTSSTATAEAGATGERKRVPMVIRSKVLLAPGRKTPSNLLPALEAKRARLVRGGRNDGTSEGARLKLVFGTAFVVTVFLQPLLVTIRALPPPTHPADDGGNDGGDGGDQGGGADDSSPSEKPPSKKRKKDEDMFKKDAGGKDDDGDEGEGEGEESDFRRKVVNLGLPTWTPTSAGLSERDDTSSPVTVAGVTSSPPGVGVLTPLVEKRLEYASSRATAVLRRCFGETAGRCYETSRSDFEVEIAEATALLQFLQIARSTYEGEG